MTRHAIYGSFRCATQPGRTGHRCARPSALPSLALVTDVHAILAKRLRALRKEQKLTQRKLAEETRIPYESYTAYERGEQRAPFWRVATLAQFFDVSMSYLAGMTDDRRPR